ncbi:hypothetical protein V500_03714 [Pseudogymnoascus sp. VKM F-4518 (FW-2643)]|nr:hypothetical protein V500_03714 [Pseudogymnoascus sp. VKM F-4518 (FW-2643)]
MSLPRVGQGQVAEYHPTEYPTSYICPEDLKATSSNNCYNPSSDDVASFLEDPQIDGPYSFQYYCDDDPQAIVSPASGPSSPSRTPLAPHIIHGDVSSDSLSSSDIPQWHNYHLQDLTWYPSGPSQDVSSEVSLGHSSPARKQTRLTNNEQREIGQDSDHDNPTSLDGPSSHSPLYPRVQRNIGTHPSVDFGQFVHMSPEPPVPDDLLKMTRKRTSRKSRGKHLHLICDSCQKEFPRRCDLKDLLSRRISGAILPPFTGRARLRVTIAE